MAGSGPAPKFNRQRSKAPTRGDWIRLSPLEAPVLPDLDEFEAPKDYEQELAPDGQPQVRVWPTRTRFMWDSWRVAHVTALWSSDDIAMAVDTIYLHATGAQGKAAEIRLRMESLGLTPKGVQIAGTCSRTSRSHPVCSLRGSRPSGLRSGTSRRRSNACGLQVRRSRIRRRGPLQGLPPIPNFGIPGGRLDGGSLCSPRPRPGR